MKHIRLWLAMALVALPVLGVAASAGAQSFRSGNDVAVAQSETVDETLFASGRTVDIAGTVNGDIFCAGQHVSISGTVNGDIICIGQDVQITAAVHGSLRAAGQSLTLGSAVDGNVTTAGQSVTFGSGFTAEDVTVAGQDATLNGSVGRDMTVSAGSAIIDGHIGRNLTAQVNHLSLNDNAAVAGNVEYTSSHTLSRSGSATIGGSITHNEPLQPQRGGRYGALLGGGPLFALYLFAALLITALVLVLLFPLLFHTASDVAMEEPLKTVIVGLASSILIPAAVFVLMVTVLGVPVGILLLLFWLVALTLSGALSAYYLGRLLIGRKTPNPFLYMLLGVVILLVLYFIPFVGIVVSALSVWFGIGMLILQIPRLPRPRYAVPVKK